MLGAGLVALITTWLRDYGWSLFLGVPFVVSFLAAFCFSYRRQVSVGSAYVVAVSSMLLLGAMIIVFALDGLICLLMALPLALFIGFWGAFMGTALGRMPGLSGQVKPPVVPMLLLVLLPGLATMEHVHKASPELRTVTTRVTIAAPAARVWPVVIAFPRITAPLDLVFALGVAYPIEARIDGTGVGAIRQCVFSTGTFVEPITAWEEPTLLAFAVTAQPEPMREMSIYPHVDAPHLHGFLVSERGEFRLVDKGDVTQLEGTTWYWHNLAPGWYWGLLSDAIIHRIHQRVLTHIGRTAEAAP